MLTPTKCTLCGATIENKLDIWDYPTGEVCTPCMLANEMPGDDFEFEYGYGFFPGGDPRDFTPDYELCAEQEVANWKADCEAWERGEQTPCPPPCEHTHDEQGNEMIITAPRYGIGTYKMIWED